METTDNGGPFVDAATIEFLERATIRLVGRDPRHPHLVVWRRSPLGQGDGTDYTFKTRGDLHLGGDGYCLVDLLDAVYSSGYDAGRQTVQKELRRVLGVRDLADTLGSWRVRFANDNACKEWLLTPHPLLGDKAPVDLLAAARGGDLHEFVLDALTGQPT